MSQFDRSDLVSLAVICGKNDRFDDVISYIKEIIKMKVPLSFKERDMMFSSYGKLMFPYISSFVSCDDSDVDEKLQRELNRKAKSETVRLCDEIIYLIDSDFLQSDTNVEAVAHYKCYRACQHSYKSCVSTGAEREFEVSGALSLFKEAIDFANKHLNPAHPVSILIASNYSEFLFDLTDSVDEALAIATEAYNKGISRLSDVSGELKSRAEHLLEQLKNSINEFN